MQSRATFDGRVFALAVTPLKTITIGTRVANLAAKPNKASGSNKWPQPALDAEPQL